MKTLKGTVTSAKMQSTVTVTVHRSVVHPLYKKRYRVSKKFLADSRDVSVNVGDEVVIAECRPMSKHKHFKVAQVLKQAAIVSEIKLEASVLDAIGEKPNTDATKKSS